MSDFLISLPVGLAGGLRNWVVYRKDFLANISPTLPDPALMMTALGLGLSPFIGQIDGLTYAQYLAPGMVATTALFTAFFECSYGFYVRMTFESVFKAMLTTPIGVREVVMGEFLWVFIRASLMAAGVGLVLAVVGLLPNIWSILVFPFIGGLLAVPCGAIGLLASAKVRNINQFQTVYSFLIAPIYFLSGVFFRSPISRSSALSFSSHRFIMGCAFFKWPRGDGGRSTKPFSMSPRSLFSRCSSAFGPLRWFGKSLRLRRLLKNPRKSRALRVAPIFGPRYVAKLIRSATACGEMGDPATPSSLRLAPCDLPKIDSNVACVGFSAVSQPIPFSPVFLAECVSLGPDGKRIGISGRLTHNESRRRFEISLGKDMAFAEYRMEGNHMVFTHPRRFPSSFEAGESPENWFSRDSMREQGTPPNRSALQLRCVLQRASLVSGKAELPLKYSATERLTVACSVLSSGVPSGFKFLQGRSPLKRDVQIETCADAARRFSGLELESRDGEGREIDQDRIGLVLPAPMLGMAPAPVADIAAAVGFGVGIQYLLVKSGRVDSHPVATPNNRRGIDDEDERLIAALAHEGPDAVVAVVEIDPLESLVAVVQLVESRLVRVEPVQMLNEAAQTVVHRACVRCQSRLWS